MSFFKINLPYGIAKNKNDEWMAFNRRYLPLGYSSDDELKIRIENQNPVDLDVFSKYKGLTEKKLLELAVTEKSIRRNEKNEIITIWLYNDGLKSKEKYWKKLEILSKLKIKHKSKY